MERPTTIVNSVKIPGPRITSAMHSSLERTAPIARASARSRVRFPSSTLVIGLLKKPVVSSATDPQDMTTTTRERIKRQRKSKRYRSHSASKSSLDETRHKLIESEDSSPESPAQEEFYSERLRKRSRKVSVGDFLSAHPLSLIRRQPAVLASRRGRFYREEEDEEEEEEEEEETQEGMEGMERLLGAVKKREAQDLASQKKSIFALLAYAQTELARIREKEECEAIELVTREVLQDTRTEWEARIQELRVEATSDLRAYSAALPRRLERLTSLHPNHPSSSRCSIGFIMNGGLPPKAATAPASARTTTVPTTGGQSQRTDFLSIPSSATAPASSALPVQLPPQTACPTSTTVLSGRVSTLASCVPPSGSSSLTPPPLTNPL